MRWKIAPLPEQKKIDELAGALSVHPVIATVLLQRGIATYAEAKSFFRPDLAKLHDPFLMKDMDKAVPRVIQAIERKEKVLVYGDYDVDGTTSVTMFSTFLKDFGVPVQTYVPDRESEGYGISFKGIDYAGEVQASLIVALDCGIRAVDKAQYAREKGLDLIICDHHSPGETLPEAVAVLNPKRLDCEYPYKGLSGCGVGFKLIQGVVEKLQKDSAEIIRYLDLVAISIAADIVPITGENRILAYHGLKIINTNPRPGIAALLKIIGKPVLNITDVVFMIAPRINAAGRLAHANLAVQVLSGEDTDTLPDQVRVLDELNRRRQDLDDQITAEALEMIESAGLQDRYTTVLYDPEWHKGVIGIVASRLIESYYRPTVVFTENGDLLTGSARSVSGFDLYGALLQCDDLIERWGGHKYAAGISILPENLQAFSERFESVVKKSIEPHLRIPELKIACEVDLDEIDMKFYRIIEQMAPFGPGNMRPVFVSSGLRDNGYGRTVGSDHSHLKMSIITGKGHRTYNGIGFGLGHLERMIRKPFKIAYTVDVNSWNGITSLQLKVKDIHAD